ncbi:MAG: peptide MFS transporter [Candidatus Obscuribacterales bacterium]|nr:peptide MFS transporter [Candidatus Obscuribacterales bacterium]
MAASSGKERTFFGHPRALGVLFSIEMCERASFYGMKAILALFLATAVVDGGLGLSKGDASAIYGWYGMAVYLTAIPGGLIADRWLGARRSVLIGGLVIAAGHFIMLLHSPFFVYAGLGLIALGTGLLKPNISTMVGEVYGGHDSRREQGFTIFYMGINIGAALAPVVCGFIAQHPWSKAGLEWCGIDPTYSWHFAFAAAGVAMLAGLAQYWWGGRHIKHVGVLRKTDPAKVEVLAEEDKRSWGHYAAIGVLCFFSVLFFCITEQGGSSLSFFAQENTRTTILGAEFPSTWFQAVNPICVIVMSPLFAWLWLVLRRKEVEPSSPWKFAIGLVFLTLGTALMVPAAYAAVEGKVSPLWLCGVYFLQVLGELCISPVGLSKVTELAPRRYAGLAVGLWFLASALAAKLGGVLAGFSSEDPSVVATLFTWLAVAAAVGALIMALSAPTVKKLMKPVF